MTYTVKIQQFEGPFDLLLSLIEKEKLSITDLSLAKITREYLRHIDEFKINTDQLAEFLNIASKLIYLKSKALLPSLANDESEEEIKEFKTQLEEYKKYKEAAEHLKEILAKGKFSRSPGERQFDKAIFFHPPETELKDLSLLFQQILKKMPDKPLEEKTIQKQVTIEEIIDQINHALKKNKTLNLLDEIKKAKSKIEIVVYFLAILELIKQKAIRVIQKENFNNAEIEDLR